MRILVTGTGGFVGRHLVRELHLHGHEVIALNRKFREPTAEVAEVFTADLRDADRIREIVASTRPDGCVHLGAIAFVPAGQVDPEEMLAVNILGTVNLLESFRACSPDARILVVSTVHVYALVGSGNAIREDSPFAPDSIYALSKAAVDTAGLAYARNHGMKVMVARPTNHTGPGQGGDFVIPSFARQLKAMANGKQEQVLHVGNLDSERDFLDVRDVVKAYRLLLDKGRAGEAYNIGGHNHQRIGDILNEMCAVLQVKPRIIVDRDRFRPTDRSPDLEVTKLIEDTGWQPEFDLSRTLRDMLSEE